MTQDGHNASPLPLNWFGRTVTVDIAVNNQTETGVLTGANDVGVLLDNTKFCPWFVVQKVILS